MRVWDTVFRILEIDVLHLPSRVFTVTKGDAVTVGIAPKATMPAAMGTVRSRRQGKIKARINGKDELIS